MLIQPDTNVDSRKPIRLMLRSISSLKQSERQILEKIGCKISTVADEIIAVEVEAGKVAELANLDFIKYVEVSSPLYLEKD
jgi:hypothetical protein